jgi:hypothetical protein
MRQTTKKGAYAPAKKKAFQNRRRPFVETKRRDKSQISNAITTQPQTTGLYPQPLLTLDVPLTDSYHMISLDPFTRMTQGYKEFEMLGDSVFSKTIQLKTEISFPQGNDCIVNPFRAYLICGWVTNPYGLSQYTSPTFDQANYLHLSEYIISQVKEHFDNTTDRLEFQEKVRTGIRIEKYSRLLPKTAESVFGPRTTMSSGAPAKVERRHTWKVNRKVHYTKGIEDTDNNTKLYSGDELVQNWYPNDSWLPFACLYMPDFGKMNNEDGVRQTLQLRHNVLHSYSDS